ncbi:unnamed protein product, partial [Allacma fusca]
MGRQPEELSQHRCPICSFRWHEIVTAVVVTSVAVDQVPRAPDVLPTGGTDAAHDPVPGTSAQVFENEQRMHTATDAANVAQESEPRGVVPRAWPSSTMYASSATIASRNVARRSRPTSRRGIGRICAHLPPAKPHRRWQYPLDTGVPKIALQCEICGEHFKNRPAKMRHMQRHE